MDGSARGRGHPADGDADGDGDGDGSGPGGSENLVHCQEVPVWSGESPASGNVTVTVHGKTGDGAVMVYIAGSGATPAQTSVPAGSSTTIPVTDCSNVTLHYQQSPTGPSTIPVDWACSWVSES